MIIDANFNDLIEWIKTMNPLTAKILCQFQDNDYSDIQMVYAAHIEPKMIPHLEFFLKKGMQLHIAPCVPSIEESHSFSYLLIST